LHGSKLHHPERDLVPSGAHPQVEGAAEILQEDDQHHRQEHGSSQQKQGNRDDDVEGALHAV
jgi:hypothetical protein